jgi:hypothetical protein
VKDPGAVYICRGDEGLPEKEQHSRRTSNALNVIVFGYIKRKVSTVCEAYIDSVAHLFES